MALVLILLLLILLLGGIGLAFVKFLLWIALIALVMGRRLLRRLKQRRSLVPLVISAYR
jgi:hypothetical protein